MKLAIVLVLIVDAMLWIACAGTALADQSSPFAIFLALGLGNMVAAIYVTHLVHARLPQRSGPPPAPPRPPF